MLEDKLPSITAIHDNEYMNFSVSLSLTAEDNSDNSLIHSKSKQESICAEE